MMTKTYLLSCCLALGSLGAQAQFVPVMRNANIATSVNSPVNEGGIHSYIRASAYGFGQDGVRTAVRTTTLRVLSPKREYAPTTRRDSETAI